MPLKRFVDVARDWLGIRTHVFAPPGEHATFLLKYADLLVGTLTVEDCVWHFKYADEFKQSNDLRPLVEFPDLNAVYERARIYGSFLPCESPAQNSPRLKKFSNLRRSENTMQSNCSSDSEHELLRTRLRHWQPRLAS
jgi:hypothetical protein